MTTAARRTSSLSVVSGWSSLEKVASAGARSGQRPRVRGDSSTRWAPTTREAAMSSIARVIFFVELTARMRCRYSRICAPIRSAFLVLLLGVPWSGPAVAEARRPRQAAA